MFVAPAFLGLIWQEHGRSVALTVGSFGDTFKRMALAVTIAIVLVVVTIRLLLPPVPGFIASFSRRWGKRTTVVLCAISLAGAALAIFVSGR